VEGVHKCGTERSSTNEGEYTLNQEVQEFVTHALTEHFSTTFTKLIATEFSNYTGPSLVFDMKRVRQRIERAKQLEGRHNCRFLFASKACADASILSFIARCGLGFDISNHNEWMSLFNYLGEEILAHVPISMTGPAIDSVRGIPAYQLTINADTEAQLQQYMTMAAPNMKLGLRVSCNPPSNYETPAGCTRFGVDELNAIDILCSSKKAMIKGLHGHRSGLKTVQSVITMGQKLYRIAQQSNTVIEYINLGGGSDQLSPDDLEDILEALRTEIPEAITLIFEFGSYWFAGSGVALGKVINTRTLADGTPALTINISRDCHLRWSAPTFIFAGNTNNTRHVDAQVFGPTCYEGDYFGIHKIPVDREGKIIVNPGDPVLAQNVDIYSVNWNNTFNGIPKARIFYHGI